MRDVIDPVNTFSNFMNNWWKIVLCAIIGGVLGLAISFFLPPIYEAEAIFSASIDFSKINFENLVDNYGNPVVWTQYEEDLTLQVVERMLLKQRGEVYMYAATLDPSLGIPDFRNNWQIERYLSMWYLRFRHADPEIAQKIVNFWVDKGSEALLDAKETGKAESFVIVDLVLKAERPQSPLYQNRGTLILAGTLIGFLGGVIWTDFQYRHFASRVKER